MKFKILKLVEELIRQNAFTVCPNGLHWEMSKQEGNAIFRNLVHVQIHEKRCVVLAGFYYDTGDNVMHIVHEDCIHYPEEVFEITDEEFREDCLNYHRTHGGVTDPRN